MTDKLSIAISSRINNVILVAEDDDISYALIEILLSKVGNKIIRAKTGKETIKLFKENTGILLILMDIGIKF